ncbi:hypothetical protein IC582_000687 [Cucumis melo]
MWKHLKNERIYFNEGSYFKSRSVPLDWCCLHYVILLSHVNLLLAPWFCHVLVLTSDFVLNNQMRNVSGTIQGFFLTI